MREQLIAQLKEKAGLDEAKAAQVVDTVMRFLKENPDRIKELLGSVPAGAGGGLGRLFRH